ncbi:Succinate dehydrogenase assembly factor 4, mitochondrial [Tolypocladium ophioglossoides CBS 100239]|uniref:Succinate dehydrogenase assembly factor 4, mitochondrial n=1 Tax=Tolypocladium ophioglossoides (strain CBS 100239) TaxID=1163406 RepID=A0A0L0NCR8_TOLOC|nr:Succinate dehydrogenase assembly factor 4, mitochondrial [Tolypocladium ophioglossoides CBS 100239]
MPRLPLPRMLLRRSTRPSSTFIPRASPPKLPAAQQAEFERLQRTAAVSAAFQPQRAAQSTEAPAADDADVSRGRGLFRGAPPEFKGDVNPRTGEVGGPKNEPLRWGGAGDWSYNGRVTDF